MGSVELRSCHNYRDLPECLELVQPLCVSRYVSGLLVDDADVWDRNQEVLE